MCGIVGKYNFGSGEPVAPELITRMKDTLVHRGPDDSGIYTDGAVGLGHRRLSIIDLSPLGRQPMSSADGKIWITFNGEIYNFMELRQDLKQKGYQFRSKSDTEVLIYLYREFGDHCVDYLRGMFAFAIWDKDHRRMFLARDRVGKKPLYYYTDGKTLIFGSELKAILEDDSVVRQINYQAVADYFKYLYIPDPKTIYENIHKLEAGHFMICDRKGIRKEQYWDVSFAGPRTTCFEDACEQLLGTIEESVRLRMISDVPLGAFLSGGIDSSLVVDLMSQQSNTPVTTCSIGFDSEMYDEVRYAGIVAEKFNTDHHEFTVRENAADIIPKLPGYFDEPFADSSAVPTFFVSKLARQKVTVALAGDGGDENFAGYQKYSMDDVENRLRSKFSPGVRKTVFPVVADFMAMWHFRLMQRGKSLMTTLSNDPDYGFFLSNTEFEDRLWKKTVNADTLRKIGGYDPFEVTRRHYNKSDAPDHFSKILYTDLKTYLNGDILVKVDRMSMAHSLEVRAPLLDHHVIEFAASLPLWMKYHQGEKKHILKEIFKDRLPHSILYRKKMGFSVPLGEWFRSEIKALATETLLDKSAHINAFFKPIAVKKIWNQHQNRSRNHGTILWALLMFELWAQQSLG